MKIFPAVDLSGGQVVRLFQGNYDAMTVYGNDPVQTAQKFREAGAKFLHVVDLDGAKDGSDANFASVAAVAKESGLFVEIGGGIRTEERIKRYLDAGVNRCILGTIAVKDFDFTVRMVQRYGKKIAIGVDTRNGFAAVSGWTETSGEYGLDLCKKFAGIGVSSIIYTDISRDGAENGTNLELYRKLVKIAGPEFTASGGISSLDELRQLRDIGIHAAIIGKSLYTGRLNLREIFTESSME